MWWKGLDILFAKCFCGVSKWGQCDENMKQDWICKPGRPRTQCPPCSTKKIRIRLSRFFVLQNLTAISLFIQVMILKSKIVDGKNLTWQGTSLVCSSTSSFVIKAVPVKPDYTSTWPIDEKNTISVRLSKLHLRGVSNLTLFTLFSNH